MTLWQSLSPPWRACVEEAWAGFCEGSWPVGAVLTGETGEIVARGRNQVFASARSRAGLEGSALAHAEILALSRLKGNARASRYALYVSTEPCPMCIGAIRLSFLAELRYASRDPFGGAIKFLTATSYMRSHKVRVFGPESPRLEQLLTALTVVRALRVSGNRHKSAVEMWGKASSAGLELGKRLYRERSLRALRLKSAPAAEMLEAIEPLLEA